MRACHVCLSVLLFLHQPTPVLWFLLADLLLFTATANTSIVTLNLSLMINTVGFYQVPKPMHAMHLQQATHALMPCLWCVEWNACYMIPGAG